MQDAKGAPCLPESVKVTGHRQARMDLLKIGLEILPIFRRMKYAIRVPEYILFADRLIAKVALEQVERPVGNSITTPIGFVRVTFEQIAVRLVSLFIIVKRITHARVSQVHAWHLVGDEAGKTLTVSFAGTRNDNIPMGGGREHPFGQIDHLIEAAIKIHNLPSERPVCSGYDASGIELDKLTSFSILLKRARPTDALWIV